jgi:hypothetical protein
MRDETQEMPRADRLHVRAEMQQEVTACEIARIPGRIDGELAHGLSHVFMNVLWSQAVRSPQSNQFEASCDQLREGVQPR